MMPFYNKTIRMVFKKNYCILWLKFSVLKGFIDLEQGLICFLEAGSLCNPGSPEICFVDETNSHHTQIEQDLLPRVNRRYGIFSYKNSHLPKSLAHWLSRHFQKSSIINRFSNFNVSLIIQKQIIKFRCVSSDLLVKTHFFLRCFLC